MGNSNANVSIHILIIRHQYVCIRIALFAIESKLDSHYQNLIPINIQGDPVKMTTFIYLSFQSLPIPY